MPCTARVRVEILGTDRDAVKASYSMLHMRTTDEVIWRSKCFHGGKHIVIRIVDEHGGG